MKKEMKLNKIKPRKILFVCTGNIFRSLSAKYCMLDYIQKNNIKDLIVNSAGTIADKENINQIVLHELNSLGIDPSKHKQKRLDKQDLGDNDLVIVMTAAHADFIKQKFGFDNVVLFNEVVSGEKTSLLDVDEVVKWPIDRKKGEKYIAHVVRYIHKSIPKLYKNLDKYLLFLDFINKRKVHRDGFPFIPLYETRNTTSFMSIAIPQKEDGHILVIPKKRYSNLDSIPKDVLSELILSVSIIGKAIRKSCGGYNLILNNGSDAGQSIFHSHFHIIPRNKYDEIKIEIWKNKKLTEEKFILLNKKIKDLIEK